MGRGPSTMALMPIPAIDLKDGGCVRLFQGRFDQVSGYDAPPEELVARYLALGTAWIHVVDLDGARNGVEGNRALIARMTGLAPGRIQVGGGIRSRSDVESALRLGAGRVVVGSAAVERPEDVQAWFGEFGPERLVLALDVRLDAQHRPWLRSRGWTRDTGLSLWDAVEGYRDVGLLHVLCTDVARDGAMSGPNLALYQEFSSRFADIRLQASGGVRDLADLEALRETRAAAAVIGKALLDGRITAEEIRAFLQSA
jgi:phosphoribosylformimino-5-aminoimidazole carboxamide ribotide isomerase